MEKTLENRGTTASDSSGKVSKKIEIIVNHTIGFLVGIGDERRSILLGLKGLRGSDGGFFGWSESFVVGLLRSNLGSCLLKAEVYVEMFVC